MTVAQMLPIVTLYASIFCPNKQPMGNIAGRDYLERSGPETWEIKCCPLGWRFVHRKCSCIPISRLSGYGHHPGNGMHGNKPFMGNGPGNPFLPTDLHGHVDMRTSSGADRYHTINHNTFQLVDFIKDNRAKQNLNSNRRNAFLLRAHRLRLKTNLSQKQFLSRRKVNSDLSLNGKHLVPIRHSQLNGKGNLIEVTTRRRENNRPRLESNQNANVLVDRHNTAFTNSLDSHVVSGNNGNTPLDSHVVSGNNGNTPDGTQWIPDISQTFSGGSPSGNTFLGNSVTNSGGVLPSPASTGTAGTAGNMHDVFAPTKSLFGAVGSLSSTGNGNFRNSIGADTTLGQTGTIGLGGLRTNGMSADIGVGLNSGQNRGGRLNSMKHDGSVGSISSINLNSNRGINSNGGGKFMNPLQANNIGIDSLNINGGADFSGNINIDSTIGRNIGLNSGGVFAASSPTDVTSVANINLNGNSPKSGKGRNFDFSRDGTFAKPLAIDNQFVRKPNGGKNSVNSHSQSTIKMDSNFKNQASIASDATFGGIGNSIVGDFGMDPLQSVRGSGNSFNLNSQDPGFIPDSGFNMFDQSNTFDLAGSVTNKDTSNQNPGGAASNGIGLDLSSVPGAELFSALMRDGGGLGEVGGNIIQNRGGRLNSMKNGGSVGSTSSSIFFPDNNINPTAGQQQTFPQITGGVNNRLLHNSDTTQSLIDQLIALNKANNMLESRSNFNSGLGDLSIINGLGSSLGLNGNDMSVGIADNIASSSFDNSIPTDPSMMNNAMLLADTRILESPTSLPPRLVTETILLETQNPLIKQNPSNRKVTVAITSGDPSVRGTVNSWVSTDGTPGRGLVVDGIPRGFLAESLIGNMGVGEARGESIGVTDFGLVNSGIVGTGLLGGGSSAGGRINERLSGGSNSLGLNIGVNTATVPGSTKVLFDGSARAPKQIVKPVGISGPHTSVGSTVTRSQSGFGVSDLQSVPRVVHRPSNEQSAIETSINQILTISAAETVIAKAAKKSTSEQEREASAANVGGRFVSQTELGLSSIRSSKDGPLSPAVCLGCTMDGGLGYIRHPSRCDKFVVCYPDRSGLFKPRVQDCPYGQFWSNIDVTCKPSKDVNCENDFCKKLADKFQFSHSTNCVAYWQCQAGHSVMRCCPEGQIFVQGEGCIFSSVCADRCPVSSPLQFMWQVNCNKRPVTSDVTAYEKQISSGWVSEKCSAGQIYKGEICDCIPAAMGNPTYSFKGVCKPEVFLPFDTDFRDYSGSNTFVRTENVTLSNGAACFDGTSVISMPKFANMDFGKTVFMNIRYKQMDLKIDTEALLYNGDCEEIPTLVVGTKPSGNSFSVKTNTGAFQTAWVPSSVQPSDWRDVTITISNGRLEGQSGISARDIDVSGGIARSHCGIKLGWGKKFKNFVGCIDEVSIYRCIPNTRMALDGSIHKSSITI